MGEESEKTGTGISGALGKAYAAVDAVRDKAFKQLGLGDWGAISGKAFGPEAARLETESREAAKQGHFLDAAALGVKSMGKGLADMVQKGAMKRVMSGEHVETHGGAPVTPAKTATPDKVTPKR